MMMMTESQVPLLETDTAGGTEAALLTLKVLFPTLMARNLRQQCWMDCVVQSCPRFICVYSWSLKM